MNVNFEGTRLWIDGTEVETPSPIRDAFAAGGGVIVLMDQFAGLRMPVLEIREVRSTPKGSNLYCYSPDGIVLWTAALPGGNNAEDYYYRISSRSPLVANSFSSYRCEIDLLTGKIIRKEFFK